MRCCAAKCARRWREISCRLTRKELLKLLGDPKRIEAPAPDDASEAWVYEYEVPDAPGPCAVGRVFVSKAESRVVGWVEPDWDELPPSSAEAASSPQP